MFEIRLTEHESEILEKALTVCMEDCAAGGREVGCEDCETLQAILVKVRAARQG